jgi:hypothetical protein
MNVNVHKLNRYTHYEKYIESGSINKYEFKQQLPFFLEFQNETIINDVNNQSDNNQNEDDDNLNLENKNKKKLHNESKIDLKTLCLDFDDCKMFFK